MRSTSIVATIGPASQEPLVLEAMIAAWMDVARLNFAHGTPELHAETAAGIPWLWDKQPMLRSTDVNGVVSRSNAFWDLTFTSLN